MAKSMGSWPWTAPLNGFKLKQFATMELCLVQKFSRVSICRFGVPHYATNNGSKWEGKFVDF